MDFEPRWVTKDMNGYIEIWNTKPRIIADRCWGNLGWQRSILILKLAEFYNKPWQECIYEVPRKTTGNENEQKMLAELERKLNAIVDAAIGAINELKGAKNV